jgi:copper(I)-binding protein
MASLRAMQLRLSAALILAQSFLLGPVFAHEFKAGAIDIEHPWSRATPGGAKVAAGYATLKNSGATPDRLVSATTGIAKSAEIHEMRMAGGVMQMRPLPEGVTVPAGGEVALKPGSYHLMFFGLKHPLSEGESFVVTLTFEQAGSVDVTFAVEGRGASASPSSEHQH